MAKNDTDQYKSQLKEDFPDLDITSVDVIGTGWHHDAVEVNHGIVFRMPRGDHGSDITAESVHYETGVLKLLRGKFDVTIPDPLYVAGDESYFGYPKVDGIQLSDVWDDCIETERDKILSDWVDVIVGVHDSVSLQQARELGIPLFSDPDTDPAETAKKIFDVVDLSESVYDFARGTIDDVAKIDIDTEQDTVIHNDLHLENMLVDPNTHQLTGVIDWTDVCIGPIARDFAVWEWRADGSLEKAAELYYKKTGKTVDIQQARLWKHLEAISDIVEADATNDVKKIVGCLAAIARWNADEHLRR